MNCSLSIVIPTIGRNALEETIQSVLTQTQMPDEIIVWDNSGTGAARQNSVYADHPAIQWRTASAQMPIIESWNTAVGYCSCDFIYILGDDDLLLPEFVNAVKKELAKGARLIHTEAILIDGDGNILAQPAAGNESKTLPANQFFQDVAVTAKYKIQLGALVFARRDLEKVGKFKNLIMNALAMDILFNLELLSEIGEITILPEPLWKYRTAVADWSGSLKKNSDIPVLIRQYLAYRDFARPLFHGSMQPMWPVFNRKLVFCQMTKLCYNTSPLRTLLAAFTVKMTMPERLYMLRDIFYLFRQEIFAGRR